MTTFATLTGITRADGECDCCGRALGRVFMVRYPDGREATLGRVCASKATGWAARAVEREAARVVRVATVEARRALVAAEFPDARPDDVLTAAVNDHWWTSDARGRRPVDATWQDYLRRIA